MSKTKNGFLFGAIILVICNLITKFISAIYRVPLLRILGSEGLGQYQMIFPIYALFLVISSSGIIVSISKLSSKELEVNNNRNAKKYFFAGFVISLISSITLSFLLLIISPTISKFQSSGNLSRSYFAIVPAIIFGSLITSVRGYYLGRKQMKYSGLIQIIEAVLKLVFSLSLAILFANNNFSMAVFGAVLGISISELIAFLFSIALYLSSKNKKYIKNTKHILKKFEAFKINRFVIFNNKILHSKNRYITFKMAIKKVFAFSFFVMLQACAMPLVSAVDSLIVVPLLLKAGLSHNLSFSLYGLEDGIVSSIISLPTFVATAIGASIIPNIKKESAQTDVTFNNIKSSFNIVWIVSVFCAFVFLFFSKEIINFLYGNGLNSFAINELKISSDLLKINSFNIIYLSFVIISTSILQALEKNKVPVINLFVAAILRIFALLVLVSSKAINIYGTAICDAIFYSFALCLNLKSIKKMIPFKLNIIKFFIFPVASCLVMSIAMKMFCILLDGFFSQRVLTMIVILLGSFVYLLLLSLTKVINIKDFSSLFQKKQKVKS